jgi:hypothetical protein
VIAVMHPLINAAKVNSMIRYNTLFLFFILNSLIHDLV